MYLDLHWTLLEEFRLWGLGSFRVEGGILTVPSAHIPEMALIQARYDRGRRGARPGVHAIAGFPV